MASSTPYVNDLKSLVIEHCSWSDITAAVPLEELVNEKKPFRIVYYSPTNFNEFNVMASETKDEELFHLREEILEVAENPDMKLDHDPVLGEIVLAPNPGHNNEYQRAIIEKIKLAVKNSWEIESYPEESSAILYFFDLGGYCKVKFSDLKPVTKPIMNFPVLSYKVALYTEQKYSEGDDHIPFNGEGLILCKSFQQFMDLTKRVDLSINLDIQESRLPMFHVTDLFNIVPVSLRCLSSSTYAFKQFKPARLEPVLLTDKLEKLKIWEWEKVAEMTKGKVNDAYIFKHGAYRKVERDISTFLMEPGTEVTAEVTRVIESKELAAGRHTAEIRAILLNNRQHMNYRTVLHNQMERYAKMVSKCPFNPAIKDMFMFKIDEKKEYIEKGVRGLGQWCRAIRMDTDWIYLLDWDENVTMQGLDSNDYDMRPLYGEFLKVPSLHVTFCPLEKDVPITFEKAVSVFKPGNRYEFRVEYTHPDNDMHEVTCFGPGGSSDPKEDEVLRSLQTMNNDLSTSSTSSTSSSDSD